MEEMIEQAGALWPLALSAAKALHCHDQFGYDKASLAYFWQNGIRL